MGDNGPGIDAPGRIGFAAQAGAAVLALLGLAAVALGVYFWALEAGTPVEEASGGMSFRGLGYALGLVLVVVGSPPLGVGVWIMRRPGSRPIGVGAALGFVYALLLLWLGLYAANGQRGIPMSPSTAIPFVVGGLFLVAAILLCRSWCAVRQAPAEG